jgi:hypothetical protein
MVLRRSNQLLGTLKESQKKKKKEKKKKEEMRKKKEWRNHSCRKL